MAQADISATDAFAARLLLALQACNLSRTQLSSILGVHKSLVSRWLSGEMRPTSHNLARISTEIARHKAGFNMSLWTAPAAQFKAALGLAPVGREDGVPQPSDRSGTIAPLERKAAWITHQSSKWLGGAIGAVLLAAIVVLLLAVWNRASVTQAPSQPGIPQRTLPPATVSIAVLPFLNMSGDPAKEYLGDGIAEEILNDLANTRDLQVASRTSSFSFKEKSADIGEIAHKLHVRTVLEGSAREEGRRIRIVAQLIDAKSGFHLWSASYDRDLGDILAVQQEIARGIVAALTQKLLAGRIANVGYHPRAPSRINPDAYTAFLQGRYAEHLANAEEFVRAVDLYKQAIRLQPDFADAHARLAMVYLGLFLDGERTDTFGPGRAEAATALRLDPDNFPALLADVRAKELLWKWSEADLAAQRLLRKHPGNPEAHFEYAMLLEDLGLWEKALLELRRAVELDPLEPAFRDNIGGPLHVLGRNSEAIAEFRQVLKLDPNFMWAFADLCPLYADMGRLDEARQILRDRLMPRYAEDRTTIYCAYDIAYRRHDMRELQRLANLAESLYARRALSASWVFYSYALLGNYEEAVRWLEKSYDDGDGNLFIAIADPILPPKLKETPGWRKFLQRPAFQDITHARTQVLAREE